jgi:AI-2 transport protein TqsA
LFVNTPRLPEEHDSAVGKPVDVTQVMVGIAASFVIIAGLRFASSFLVPLVFAAVLTALFSPLVTWVAGKGIPAWAGALFVLVIELAILTVVGLVLAMAASEITERAPYYISRAQAGIEALRHAAGRFGMQQQVPDATSVGDHVMPMLGAAAGTFATTASDLAVVLLVVLFSLAEFAGVGEKVRVLAPLGSPVNFERVDHVVRDIQKYLVVKTLTSLLAAGSAFILLKVFGVGLALLLAVIMFLLHFIPNVGTFLATVPAVLITLIDRGAGAALGIGLSFLIVNTLIGSVLEPRVLGRTLGVSPFVILVAMLFWGWAWGPAGALLAVPLTAAGKIVLENTRFAWIARLVEPASEHGSEPEKVAPKTLRQRLSKPLTVKRAAHRGIGLGAKAAREIVHRDT